MKKVLLLLSLVGIFTVKAQSNTVTVDEQFNTSGISNSAPAYQPVKESTQSQQSMYSDWVNKIKEPAISEDIRPEIREAIKDVKSKPTPKEPDKVQAVINEMFPNKIPLSYQALATQPIKTVEQKPVISVNKPQSNSFNGLFNVILPLLIIIGMILFFLWMNTKRKINEISTTPPKEKPLSYSQREERLKETLIESAKQTLALDLREMEIKGILDDKEIATNALLRVYEEISLGQIEEYSKLHNIPKIEVENIIRDTYQILQIQYHHFFNRVI